MAWCMSVFLCSVHVVVAVAVAVFFLLRSFYWTRNIWIRINELLLLELLLQLTLHMYVCPHFIDKSRTITGSARKWEISFGSHKKKWRIFGKGKNSNDIVFVQNASEEGCMEVNSDWCTQHAANGRIVETVAVIKMWCGKFTEWERVRNDSDEW